MAEEVEIDQEVFDKLIAEGKSERLARAKAKAAFVRKRKAEILAEREVADGGSTTREAAQVEPEASTEPKKAEIHVEDAGEIDQETYDALIAEGKSERIARAKAKAAYVRKRKQELASEGGDE